MPRIALIHATALAIAPVNDAFARLWPQATLMNLLDDSLSADHARNNGALTEPMRQRFIQLAHYAKGTGCNAILFTCSAFGPAIEGAATSVGMVCMKPNEAMFDQALALCSNDSDTAALIATFEPSLAPMAQEFAAVAAQSPGQRQLSQHFVPDAMALLAQGQASKHHELIAQKAAQIPARRVLMLAQFSMAAAKHAVEKLVSSHTTVLTSPDCAVLALQQKLGASL
jgi:hypothetical protein